MNLQRQPPYACRSAWGFAISVCLLFGSMHGSYAGESRTCIVEELTFRVSPDHLEEFIEVDDQIWTQALSEQEGFLGKSIWTSAKDKSRVRLIIYWRSHADWHAVPQSLLAQTERAFAAAMPGSDSYKLISSKALQQRSPRKTAMRNVAGADLAAYSSEWHRLATNVTIENDQAYHRTKRYRALPLRKVVEVLFDFPQTDIDETQLVFHCTDDYHVSMPLANALQSGGWLALHDLDAPDNASWFQITKGTAKKSPAPFYVVWSEKKGVYQDYPWPYAVTHLELVPSGKSRPN